MIVTPSFPGRGLRLAITLAAFGLCGGALAAPFSRSLSLHGVISSVEAKGEESVQQLSVQARRNGKPFATVREEPKGRVIGAEGEDLNSDGQPDLFVDVESAGSSWRSSGCWISIQGPCTAASPNSSSRIRSVASARAGHGRVDRQAPYPSGDGPAQPWPKVGGLPPGPP